MQLIRPGEVPWAALFVSWLLQTCHGFSPLQRRTWLRQSVTVLVGGMVGPFPPKDAKDALAVGVVDIGQGALSSSAPSNSNGLNLFPPTEDQPQISLPTRKLENEPLVQGILYLKNPGTTRPPLDSVVLVTVRTASEPDVILLAAQIPIANQRLPLQFQFPRRPSGPAIPPSEDLIVLANVCLAENVNRITKTCADSILSGSGTAKALQLQSPDDPSQTLNFRAGVSVALN